MHMKQSIVRTMTVKTIRDACLTAHTVSLKKHISKIPQHYSISAITSFIICNPDFCTCATFSSFTFTKFVYVSCKDATAVLNSSSAAAITASCSVIIVATSPFDFCINSSSCSISCVEHTSRRLGLQPGLIDSACFFSDSKSLPPL